MAELSRFYSHSHSQSHNGKDNGEELLFAVSVRREHGQPLLRNGRRRRLSEEPDTTTTTAATTATELIPRSTSTRLFKLEWDDNDQNGGGKNQYRMTPVLEQEPVGGSSSKRHGNSNIPIIIEPIGSSSSSSSSSKTNDIDNNDAQIFQVPPPSDSIPLDRTDNFHPLFGPLGEAKEVSIAQPQKNNDHLHPLFGPLGSSSSSTSSTTTETVFEVPPVMTTSSTYQGGAVIADTPKYERLPGFIRHSVLEVQYGMWLSISLLVWVFYLILPKGFRVQYCRAYPRRYAKSQKRSVRGRWVLYNPNADTAGSISTMGGGSPPTGIQRAVAIANNFSSISRDDESLSRRGYSPHQHHNINNEENPDDEFRQGTDWHQKDPRRRIRPPSVATSMGDISMTYAETGDVGRAAAGYYVGQNNRATPRSYSRQSTTKESTTSTWGSASPSVWSSVGGGGGGDGPEEESSDHYNNNIKTSDYSGSSSRPKSRMSASTASPPPHSYIPLHPDLKEAPPVAVVANIRQRLLSVGVKLTAHGVQCQPKRVWVSIATNNNNTSSSGDPYHYQVMWQTEFPKRLANGSYTSVRGARHAIALRTILYVDVGKRTHALRRMENSALTDDLCFSLLTKQGSLDLQATTAYERDALVSLFCAYLDKVHADEDWRELYCQERDDDTKFSETELHDHHDKETTEASEPYYSDMGDSSGLSDVLLSDVVEV